MTRANLQQSGDWSAVSMAIESTVAKRVFLRGCEDSALCGPQLTQLHLNHTEYTLRKPCGHSEQSFVVLVINQGEQSEV
jgi:hypothetical protein